MEKNKKNYSIIVIAGISVIFGLASGVVGELLFRAYVIENEFKIPLFGEINIGENTGNGSNLIIRDAKMVVVNQDVKVADTINAVSPTIVGIYKKILPKEEITKDSSTIPKFYLPANRINNGFILTSDGWIVTKNFLSEFKDMKKITAIEKKNIINDYVVITNDKKIYNIEDLIFDDFNNIFFHINATDLPVSKLVSQEIKSGLTVLAINWKKSVQITEIVSITDKMAGIIQSSDSYELDIKLADAPVKEFYGNFIFNLNGDLLGFINNKGEIEFINNNYNIISGLKTGIFPKRASLGLFYLNLDQMTPTLEQEEFKKGALIAASEKQSAVAKGSAAEKAGLKSGDIILSVDNTEIGGQNTLNRLIYERNSGKEISMTYLRGKEKRTVRVILDELK